MTFRHIMDQVPKVRERWRDERRDEKDNLSQLLHVLWALLQTSAIQSRHHFFNYFFFYGCDVLGSPTAFLSSLGIDSFFGHL